MATSRRSFIKRLGAGVACAAIAPELIAAEGGKKKAPVGRYPRLDYDVIVAGAGPGGIASAVAAARNGARVLLIEEDMTPGGAPVDMYVTFMCGGPRVGLFRQLVQTLNNEFPVGGIPCDTFGKSGSDGKNHWWMPSSFAIAYRRLIESQPGIDLMCGAPVFDAMVKDKGNRNQVYGVRVIRNGCLQEITAPVTIDATGAGIGAATAGGSIM